MFLLIVINLCSPWITRHCCSSRFPAEASDVVRRAERERRWAKGHGMDRHLSETPARQTSRGFTAAIDRRRSLGGGLKINEALSLKLHLEGKKNKTSTRLIVPILQLGLKGKKT